MQEIIKTELLNVSVDQLKNRLYCTMRGFWKNDEQKTNRLKSVFQQFSQQQMVHKGTAVIDTTGLRLMRPQVAEFVLLDFMRLLLDNHIKALAHVRNPDNVLLKMQFQRVLRSCFERGDNEVQYQTFHERQEAENWLDAFQEEVYVCSCRVLIDAVTWINLSLQRVTLWRNC